MSTTPEEDEEACEHMLDMLHFDLESAEKDVRHAAQLKATCLAQLELATRNLINLKSDAVKVVLLTEYQSTVGIRRRAAERLQEAEQEAAEMDVNLSKVRSDIRDTEDALQLARNRVASPPSNTAKILEFPNANC